MCIYNTYRKLYSVLSHLNCHFFLTSFHNLSNLTEANIKIQHEIQGGPESPFPLIYIYIWNKQVSKKPQTSKKPPEKFYEGVQEHILGFKKTFYSI